MNALLIYGISCQGDLFSSGKGGNSVAFLMEHEHFIQSYTLSCKIQYRNEETELTDAEKSKYRYSKVCT
jgi:hypothetical protein